MTSRCSRSSQPNNAARIRCSGSTHRVYDKAERTQFSDTTRAGWPGGQLGYLSKTSATTMNAGSVIMPDGRRLFAGSSGTRVPEDKDK